MCTWELARGARAVIAIRCALWAAVLTPACSSNRHGVAGDAGAGDTPADAVVGDTAVGDAAGPDAGTTPLPPSACGYTATCVMGTACDGVAQDRAGRSAAPSDACTCLRYDPVPCLDHRLLALGLGHICAVVGDGIQCWGSNAHGALGSDTPDRSLVPIPVDGLAGVIPMITGSGTHTCAIVEGGGQTIAFP
jgi:hypothetical protein